MFSVPCGPLGSSSAIQSRTTLSVNTCLMLGLIMRNLIRRRNEMKQDREQPKSVGSGFRFLVFQFWLYIFLVPICFLIDKMKQCEL